MDELTFEFGQLHEVGIVGWPVGSANYTSRHIEVTSGHFAFWSDSFVHSDCPGRSFDSWSRALRRLIPSWSVLLTWRFAMFLGGEISPRYIVAGMALMGQCLDFIFFLKDEASRMNARIMA